MDDPDYIVQRSEDEGWYVIRIWIKKTAMKGSINALMGRVAKIIPGYIKETK